MRRSSELTRIFHTAGALGLRKLWGDLGLLLRMGAAALEVSYIMRNDLRAQAEGIPVR